MKKILIYSLFGVFLASNVSKWYVSISGDFRIYYNHIALLLWLSLAIPYLLSASFRIPGGIKILIFLKAVFIVVVLLAIPALRTESQPLELITYIKGVLVAGFEGFSLIFILLFITRLKPAERNTVINLYLASITVSLAYTLLQVWAIYAWDADLDAIIAPYLPLWSGNTPGIAREIFGLASGTYYRFNGFTGDPNLNGMTFLVVLPLIFVRAFEKGSLFLGALFLLFVGAIVLTVSNTAILLMLPILLLLSLRYWRRSKWPMLATGCAFAVLSTLFLFKYGAEVAETLRFKLAADDGTASSHLNIATEALSIWRAHPFGVGVGSYPYYSSEYSTHDSYLQALVELGPLGLVVRLSWVLYCLSVCLRSHNRLGFATALAVGALAIGAVAHDFLDRFEFELAINVLVALVILNHRKRTHASTILPIEGTVPSTAGDSAQLSVVQ